MKKKRKCPATVWRGWAIVDREGEIRMDLFCRERPRGMAVFVGERLVRVEVREVKP